MNDRTLEGEATVRTGRKTRRQPCIFLGAICVLVIGLYASSARSGWLELAGLSAANNYYNLLVQGFRAGQLNLRSELPSGLLQGAAPPNPAPNAWLHDLSSYQGKLYLYFGVTPALILFWPWYELTSHYLLHRAAVVVFCTVGFLAGVGLLVALWRRYFEKIAIGVVGACSLALGLAGGAPLLLARSDVYEVAISCGYAFTMLALAGIWGALHDLRRRELWLVLASLGYGLAVAARPALLLGAAILFLPVARAWRETAEPDRRRRRWTLLLAAAGPIALIGMGLMLYNTLRFDNPLEFGQRYQLNLETRSTPDQFSLGYLWFNFRVSFLEPVCWSGRSPFVQNIVLPPMPQGSNVEYPFGVLSNIPFVWLVLAASLAWRSRLAEARSALRWFVVAVALLFGACALTLCLHNSMNIRYEMEFASPLALLAVVGIFSLERGLAGWLAWRRASRWGWGLLLAFSVLFNLFGRFQLYSGIHADYGFYLLDQGRIGEAITHFQKALAIQPEHGPARNGLGKALCQKGLLAEAISDFQKAIKIEPNNADPHFNLGAVLFRLGRVSEAVPQLEEALRLKPGDAEAHNNLGIALVRLGRTPEAIGHYDQALRLKPDFAEAHHNLGKVLVQLGRMEEAIGHLEHALRLKPNFAEAHNDLGIALFWLRRMPEAVGQYEQALRLMPDHVGIRNNLARVLATCGDGAVRKGARAVELAEGANQVAGGKDAAILDTLAAAYAEAGRFGEAVKTAQVALELVKESGLMEQAQQIQNRLQLYQAGRPYHEGSVSAP